MTIIDESQAVTFDDTGELLSDGRFILPHRAAR